MKKTLTEKNSERLLWVGLLLFIIGVVVFLNKENFFLDSKVNAEKAAQFGDFIGGIVGSLWSLAGVILFYVALKEQRQDIKINRATLEAQVSALNQQIKEFELQRSELEETRKVFEDQSETLRIQRFENTFFNLLSLHHDLVEKLNISDPHNYSGPSLEKREVLSRACKDLKLKIRRSNQIHKGLARYEQQNPESKEVAIDRLKEVYASFYFDDYKQLLSHYFRNLYHIFKFIYFSDLIEKPKKQFYATLLRAQLSSDEMFLILYNSLHDGLGYPNFLYLIKEFDIMQNFDFDIISDYPFHKDIYEDSLKNVKPQFVKPSKS